MWLSPKARAQPCPTPHQYAAYRIVLGVALLAALSVSSADTAQWLELPRTLRNALHVLPFVVGIGLCLGTYRRAFAAAGAVLALTLASLHHTAWSLAGVVVAQCALAAAIPRGEPWAAFSDGDELTEAPHWYTAAWGVNLAATWSWVLAAASATLWLLGGAATLITVAIAMRGPKPLLALLGLLLNLSSGLLTEHWGVTLLLWLPTALACISTDWLPARRPRAEPPIVFFDGVCGFCDSGMRLLVAEDVHGTLRIAPLQGETSQRLLHRSPNAAIETMILLDDGKQYSRSNGAFRAAEYLGGIWRLAAPFGLLPTTLRDAAYDWVARNRYAWFGKVEACRIPTASERGRYLD